jgi:hypothetical protein
LSHPYKLKKSAMAATSFDPTHAVRFDLPQGRVLAGNAGEGERVLLVPSAAIDDIALSAPPEAVAALGHALGAAIGRRAAARMGDPQNASMETFVTQLAGEAAIAGVGALSVERWGRAMVVVVEGSPLNGTLLAPLVGAAIEAASGRGVSCTLLSRDEHVARLLVGGERGVARVREWMAAGVPWGEALAKLQGVGS